MFSNRLRINREIVLGKLDKMVKEFVYVVYVRKGYPDQIAKEAGGKIFTFGSYRLGVHGSGKYIPRALSPLILNCYNDLGCTTNISIFC